jgi:hypothetical protein
LEISTVHTLNTSAQHPLRAETGEPKSKKSYELTIGKQSAEWRFNHTQVGL